MLHFNSIKVRLELISVLIQLRPPLFQFHKGAIRTAVHDDWKSQFIGFQFHKGAIRTQQPVTSPLQGQSFQFHKGAIRTGIRNNSVVPILISIP